MDIGVIKEIKNRENRVALTPNGAKALVAPGDRVERGDVVAAAAEFISSAVHATASGTVKSIELWPHPNGSMVPSIRIDVDPNSAQSSSMMVMLEPATLPSQYIPISKEDMLIWLDYIWETEDNIQDMIKKKDWTLFIKNIEETY